MANTVALAIVAGQAVSQALQRPAGHQRVHMQMAPSVNVAAVHFIKVS